MSPSQLFAGLTLRGLELKNRVVVSPMWQYAGRNGFPTDWHLMHLGRYADGGAGLVFQEGTTVERRGCGTLGDLGLWDDQYVEPLSRLVRIIKDNGAVPGIQLMHAGRKARMSTPMEGRRPLARTPDITDWDEWEPIAPSPLPIRDGLTPPREMTERDIEEVIAAFVSAAVRAHAAGYEVVELHAGHGYLLHQFLSTATNQRTDCYGGSFANRTRLLKRVVEGVRSVWPQDKPLFARLSVDDGGGWDVDDSVRLVEELLPLGVDVVDCSSGGLVGSPMEGARDYSYGYQIDYAAEVKRRTGAPTMAVGLVVHPELAEQIVAEGSADLVAVAREMLYNPNWPLDAAMKLGVEDPYAITSLRTAYWLRRRAETVPGLVPSTFTPQRPA
jgi:2,4-dienoyl-CoA reductase-like NADH-dependent reductase (Old Yellow Enzyme family)